MKGFQSKNGKKAGEQGWLLGKDSWHMYTYKCHRAASRSQQVAKHKAGAIMHYNLKNNIL